MINDEQSVLVRPRVFYTGLVIAVALLATDYWLLVRAHGTERQLEIYLVLFTLATLSVLFRYRSTNPKLKRLGGMGVWALILILLGAAGVFLTQPQAAPQNEHPAAAPAGAPAPPEDAAAPDNKP